MDGGVPAGAYSTRTSLKTMFVDVVAAVCGRIPRPSKLKFDAAVSVTVVESVVPFAAFIQVAVICNDATSIRCTDS